jgi:hypothetical protein
MNLSELQTLYQQVRKGPIVNPFGLRKKEYQNHYPLIKEAVLAGLDLMTIIKIIREKEGAFEGATDQAVWQAFSRALKEEKIALKRGRRKV